jgi:hypothetical protein
MTTRSSDKTWYAYDGFDGAFIAHVDGLRVETWGEEHPNLAIRNRNNGGGRLRFDDRSAEEWHRLIQAVRGGTPVRANLNGWLRDANEVERGTTFLVSAGRSKSGGIIIEMLPLLEPDRAMKVTLSREAADVFARGMEVTRAVSRKALIVEALHNDLEMTNERTR